MIGRMLPGIIGIATLSFVAGVAHSGFKHYYRKYADEEDLSDGSVQNVHILKDETKKTRGRK